MSCNLILVVEDDKPTREIIVKYLRILGHDVCEAEDGIDGFQKAIQQMPDVILSDIEMPRHTGWQLFNQLRQGGFKKPMILMSGNDELLDVQMIHHDPPPVFLLKPFSLDELDKALEEVVMPEAFAAG